MAPPFFLQALSSIALVLFLAGCSRPETLHGPNIVILIADDLGWEDLGAYGNTSVKTPHIDSLASQGLRFDNAFLTTASCSASRASILTGRYPHSNGAMHLHQALPAGEATMARHLRDAGYYTAAVGKWHLGDDAAADFDRPVEDNESASGSRRWLDELRRRPRGRPFFFWLAAHDPHRPFAEDQEDMPPPVTPADVSIPWGFADGPGTRLELAQYLSEVQRFDQRVGEVVSELAAQGVLEETLIIVMSDNGRPFHLGKLTLYDEGIKTPFILYWPARIREPGTRAALLSAVDVAPTLLELAGLHPPDTLQGKTFLPLLDDDSAEIRKHVFAERNWHGRDAHERVVRSEEYLYKVNQHPLHGHCARSQFSQTAAYRELVVARQAGALQGWLQECFESEWPGEELYRIGPAGMIRDNIVAAPEYRGVLESMREVMASWRQATGDADFEPWRPDYGSAGPCSR